MKAGDVITVRGEGGAVFEQTVPSDGSPHREILDDFLAKGKLFLVSEPEPEEDLAPAEVVEDGEDLGVPARNASTAAWQSYAVAQGMDEEEAAGLSRDDLVDRYLGSDED